MLMTDSSFSQRTRPIGEQEANALMCTMHTATCTVVAAMYLFVFWHTHFDCWDHTVDRGGHQKVYYAAEVI